MRLVLLDTNVLIDVLNDRRGRRVFLDELFKDGVSPVCCAITVAEVYAGVRDQERVLTDALFENLVELEITRSVAIRAGLLKRDWARKGITLTLPDVLIAAVAIEYGALLATDNQRDFPMPELRMLSLPKPS